MRRCARHIIELQNNKGGFIVTMQESSKNITLIGMPGAGKSTLGVVLAKRRGLRFVDTDLLIQEGSGRLLSQIIEQDGLDAFLDYENKVLAGLECTGHVISTGGSACYGAEAMAHLKAMSTVVYIDIPLDEMLRRLGDLVKRGVAIRPGLTIQDVYEERKPLYEKYADIVFTSGRMSTREAVESLDELLTQHGL